MAQATGLAGYWGSSSMFFLVFSFDSLSRKIVTQFFYDSLHVKGSHDTGVVKVRKGYDKDPGVILRTWHILPLSFQAMAIMMRGSDLAGNGGASNQFVLKGVGDFREGSMAAVLVHGNAVGASTTISSTALFFWRVL